MARSSAAPPPARAVWGRDFTLYFLGVVCSMTGYWVRFVAQGWLVYRLTDSPFQLGLVGFFTTLPVFFFSPLAGAAVDRFDRRRVLAVTQGGTALTILTLALLDSTSAIQVWQVYAIAFVGGAFSAFDWPARLSLAPNLVAPPLMPTAVALNSAAWNGARIGGPVVAGLLLPAVGTAGSFWVAAALFVPVMLALPFIRLRPVVGGGRARGDLLANLRGGYAYMLGSSLLLTLLLMELVPVIFGQTVPNLMPAFVREALAADERTLGWLVASLGVGELLGTLLVALTPAIPRRPAVALTGVVFFGLTLMAFSQTRSLIPALLSLGLVGLCAAIYSTLNGILIQGAVDDRYRGRVMSVYSMVWGLTPIGSLELGALAQLLGAPTAVLINGGIVVAFALALLLRMPSLRTMKG